MAGERSRASARTDDLAPSTARLCLGLVLLAALALRLWGLGWSIPWAFHWDEADQVSFAAAQMVDSQTLDPPRPSPAWLRTGSFTAYLVAAELLAGRQLGLFAADSVAAPLWAARLTSVAFALVSVAAVYAMGAALASRRVGLIAAALLAAAYLHVHESHFGYSDVTSVGLCLVSLWGSVYVQQTRSLGGYALAGVAGGLAMAAKYHMALWALPLLVAHLQAPRAAGQRWWTPSALGPLALAGLLGAVSFVGGTPSLVLNWPLFRTRILEQATVSGEPWPGQSLEQVLRQYLTTLGHGFGVIALLLALIGIVVLARGRWRALALLGVLPLVYLGFMSTRELFVTRYALPLVPFLSLFAALGIVALAQRAPPANRTPVLIGLLAVGLAQPLALDVRGNHVLTQRDTRVLAWEWMQSVLPGGSGAVIQIWTVHDTQWRMHPPNDGRLLLRVMSQWEGAVDYYARRGVDYLVTSDWNHGLVGHATPYPAYVEAQRALDGRAELLARFAPGVGGRDVPPHLSDLFGPYYRVFARERPGPTVEVYSLAPLRAQQEPLHVDGIVGGWITAQGVDLIVSAEAAPTATGVLLQGHSPSEWLPAVPEVVAHIYTLYSLGPPVPARLRVTDNIYELYVDLEGHAPTPGQPLWVHLDFTTSFQSQAPLGVEAAVKGVMAAPQQSVLLRRANAPQP